MVAMEIGINNFSVAIGTVSERKKKLHQKLESYRFYTTTEKIGLIGSVQSEIKHHNLKKCKFF